MVKRVKRVSRKKAKKIVVNKGVAHIKTTYNNTIVTITDESGNALFSSSGGCLGFKGAKKRTVYAGRKAAASAARLAYAHGLRRVMVKLNGVGFARLPAIKAIHRCKVKVTAIADVTRLPHNGCRPRKRKHGKYPRRS
jgi:small subunit ribosomal protein S11